MSNCLTGVVLVSSDVEASGFHELLTNSWCKHVNNPSLKFHSIGSFALSLWCSLNQQTFHYSL